MGDRAALIRIAAAALAIGLSGCASTPPAGTAPVAVTAVSASAAASIAAWPRAQAVRIPSRDGTRVTGWWLPASDQATEASDSAATTPRPVVVVLHGCGGLYSSARDRQGILSLRHGGMADRLREQGWHVVLPDSLSARGERSLCEQRFSERRVHGVHRRDDTLGTLQWLAAQPWADTRNVALLGWSHGGSAVLSATDLRDAAVRAQAVKPKAAVAFYPGCAEALQRGYRPAAPLLMLLGEKDDWTAPGPCMDLGRAVSATVRVYADSYHGFDEPTGGVRFRRDVPNGVNPGQGVHVGRNPLTGPQAWNDAIAYLRDAFKPS